MLVNLIGNAVKFTHRGGITVAAEYDDDRDQPRLVVTVTDTGVGIAHEKLTSIFEPFAQADGSISRKYGGTGLGLSISTRLVSLMGGELTVSSTSGEGSTFRFWLPVRSGCRHGPRPAGCAPAGKPARGACVLVVEDNPVNQRLAAALLARAGYQVRIAATGGAALAALDAGPFDLVLMDVQMPDMTGVETASHIRRRPGNGRIPIVAMTAHVMESDREACYAAGMDAFLAKPTDATCGCWRRSRGCCLRPVSRAASRYSGSCSRASRSCGRSATRFIIPPTPANCCRSFVFPAANARRSAAC